MIHLILSHRWPLGILFFALLLVFTACESSPLAPTASRQEEAIAIAKQELPSQGVLEQGPDGFVYLKVNDQYVHRLFPLVRETGFEIPSSIRRHTKIGAHISVFYTGEAHAIGPIHELGRKYFFEPQRIRIVRSGRKEYLILEVESPQLAHLRQQYGLSPKLMNHEFHITLAEKNLRRFNP